MRSALTFNILFFFSAVVAAQQTPVHEEPFHQPIWENEACRILSLEMSPGDTSEFHLHDTPILYLFLRKSEVYLEILDGKPKVVSIPDGWIGSDFYSSENSLIHRIAPSRRDTLRVLAVQLKEGQKLDKDVNAASKDAIYSEHGFTVRKLYNGDLYFQNTENRLPIIISDINPNFLGYSRGKLISAEEYENNRAEILSLEAEFWAVYTNLN